ncbi:MAG: dTDP-glucose 4,6-dehydratase [Pseudomonadota bacterium]
MTILVTGGAGFIGANFIIDWLDETDEPIVNLDKLTYSGNAENLSAIQANPAYTFFRGDIGDPDRITDILQHYQPRAIVNFAAESHVDRSIHGPEAFIETNVVGTYRLLQSVRRYWDGLSGEGQDRFRFLHVSTDEVYGSLDPDAPGFGEDHPYRPNSPYSASKAASDHFVRAWGETYGLPVLITNCSNNYGPFQFPEKLIPLMILNGLSGADLPVYGDGLQVRDWLYVADHCAALRTVLASGRIGTVYNIGGGAERTNLTVVEAVCRLLDTMQPRADSRSHRDQIRHVTDRPGHDRRYAIDSSRIEAELGWRPSESFETGLERTVAWYLSHQVWCRHITDGSYRDWLSTNYSDR